MAYQALKSLHKQQLDLTAKCRSYLVVAKRLWKHNCWVDLGTRTANSKNARYALLAHCRDLSITLWDKVEDSLKAKAAIDKLGCGGGCYGRHEIYDLGELPRIKKTKPLQEKTPKG